jgi:hypothetical protein
VRWWDRLLGTYRAQSREGHEAMTVGIEQFRTKHDLWLYRMLVQPLISPASSYPIKRERRDRSSAIAKVARHENAVHPE